MPCLSLCTIYTLKSRQLIIKARSSAGKESHEDNVYIHQVTSSQHQRLDDLACGPVQDEVIIHDVSSGEKSEKAHEGNVYIHQVTLATEETYT